MRSLNQRSLAHWVSIDLSSIESLRATKTLHLDAPPNWPGLLEKELRSHSKNNQRIAQTCPKLSSP